jgi:hypothetical protein
MCSSPCPLLGAHSNPRPVLGGNRHSGKSSFKVLLTKEPNSELLKLIADKVQAFVDAHGGKLPNGAEWKQVIDINGSAWQFPRPADAT